MNNFINEYRTPGKDTPMSVSYKKDYINLGKYLAKEYNLIDVNDEPELVECLRNNFSRISLALQQKYKSHEKHLFRLKKVADFYSVGSVVSASSVGSVVDSGSDGEAVKVESKVEGTTTIEDSIKNIPVLMDKIMLGLLLVGNVKRDLGSCKVKEYRDVDELKEGPIYDKASNTLHRLDPKVLKHECCVVPLWIADCIAEYCGDISLEDDFLYVTSSKSREESFGRYIATITLKHLGKRMTLTNFKSIGLGGGGKKRVSGSRGVGSSSVGEKDDVLVKLTLKLAELEIQLKDVKQELLSFGSGRVSGTGVRSRKQLSEEFVVDSEDEVEVEVEEERRTDCSSECSVESSFVGSRVGLDELREFSGEEFLGEELCSTDIIFDEL